MKAKKIKTRGAKRAGKSASMRQHQSSSVFAVVAMIIVVFAIFYQIPSAKAGSNEKWETFIVSRGNLTISVIESGNIKSLDSVDIKSEVEGTTTILSIIEEGAYITSEDVNNGKVLVELDSSEIKDRLTKQEIKCLSAEADYTEASESLDIQKKQNDSNIQIGQLQVEFALMDLKKYLGKVVAQRLIGASKEDPNSNIEMMSVLNDPGLGGTALQKLKELKDNITLTKSKFSRASDKLNWTNKLFRKNYVAETELKADELEVESLKVQTENAKIALKLFERYEFPKEAKSLLSSYIESECELERIEAHARSKLTQAQAQLKSKEVTYSLEKKLLEKLHQQLEACVLKAPSPGQVVYASSINPWLAQKRGAVIEMGAKVTERQKILLIPDTSKMKVEVKIHEAWVGKLQEGQSAKITIAAFPDKIFHGKVLKKAPLADQQNWMNPDLRVYSTDVSIEGTYDSLKIGMTAEVEIVLDELKDILSVPMQTIINHERKKICFVVNGDKSEQRMVETGGYNENFVEIKSGLAEGEKVLLNPPRLIEAKQMVNE